MKSQNSTSFLVNIQLHLNSIISSYNTINMILNPNLNNYKQNFLSTLISTIISQLNFMVELSKEKEQDINKLIQSNISTFSKNIANLLSFVNERKFILSYNHQISFSLLNKMNIFSKINKINKLPKEDKKYFPNSTRNKENPKNKINFPKEDLPNNKKEIRIKKINNNNNEIFRKSAPPSYLRKSKLLNGNKYKIRQQLSKKKINANKNVINKSLDNNNHSLSNSQNYLLNSNLINKKNKISNLCLSHRINKSSPNIFKRGDKRCKSAFTNKYNRHILSDDYFNEKITSNFEEKGAKATYYTKYLISTFKRIVENYEKLDYDEQLLMEGFQHFNKGKKKKKIFINKKKNLNDEKVLRYSNKNPNNTYNNSNNNINLSKISDEKI